MPFPQPNRFYLHCPPVSREVSLWVPYSNHGLLKKPALRARYDRLVANWSWYAASLSPCQPQTYRQSIPICSMHLSPAPSEWQRPAQLMRCTCACMADRPMPARPGSCPVSCPASAFCLVTVVPGPFPLHNIRARCHQILDGPFLRGRLSAYIQLVRTNKFIPGSPV